MFRLVCDETSTATLCAACCLGNPISTLFAFRTLASPVLRTRKFSLGAAEENRIVLTHDRATMARYAFERVASGQPLAGIFIVNDRFPVGRAIEEILLVVDCTQQPE